MNILALDLASATGWATLYDGNISSGVQEFGLKRGESAGMRFLRYRAWLKTMEEFCPNEVELIVYEQAHHRGGAATQLCVGLVTDTLAFAADIGAETMPVHSAVLKKWATGKGNSNKEKMIDAAKAMGCRPKDDNEADAFLLLKYAMDELKITVE